MSIDVDRERVLRTLTFWLRPEFVLRVFNRFQKVAGFDRAIALASSTLTARKTVSPPIHSSPLSEMYTVSPAIHRRPLTVLRTLSGLSSHVCSNSRCTVRVKLNTAITRKNAPRRPMLVSEPDAGAKIALTASAPPPVSS